MIIIPRTMVGCLINKLPDTRMVAPGYNEDRKHFFGIS